MGKVLIALALLLLISYEPSWLFALIIVIPIWLYRKAKPSKEAPIRLSEIPKTERVRKETQVWSTPEPEKVNKKAQALPASKPPKNRQDLSHENMTWVGLGEAIEINGYVIKDPLIYWVPSDQHLASQEASCILKSARISNTFNDGIESLGYWPTYLKASPNQKAYYLNWLATGKKANLEDIGYAFLYFYGLEYRALVERENIPLIINESLRDCLRSVSSR